MRYLETIIAAEGWYAVAENDAVTDGIPVIVTQYTRIAVWGVFNEPDEDGDPWRETVGMTQAGGVALEPVDTLGGFVRYEWLPEAEEEFWENVVAKKEKK